MTTPTRKRQLARMQLARCFQASPEYWFFLKLIHKYEDEVLDWHRRHYFYTDTELGFRMAFPHL